MRGEALRVKEGAGPSFFVVTLATTTKPLGCYDQTQLIDQFKIQPTNKPAAARVTLQQIQSLACLQLKRP